ncbi:MAG: AraC family transcriptional regulator [Chloroflexota bacterium]
MSYSEHKLNEFVARLKEVTVNFPINEPKQTSLEGIYVFKGTECGERYPAVYDPAIVIMAQGKKIGRVNDLQMELSVGRFTSIFLPIAWEVEVVEASEEKPLIMLAIKMDLGRIANILMKMDKVSPILSNNSSAAPSGIYSEPLTDDILDTMIRILNMVKNPLEMEVLGDALVDELYFRLICNDSSGSMQRLLHHRGEIPQISRVITHIHENLDEVISVSKLAEIVNMSPSGFRKIFRDVMHMPPLQYAKSIKLDQAQIFIRQGLNASEAGFKVGYNSPAQFSREYKRHFGYTPSETAMVSIS